MNQKQCECEHDFTLVLSGVTELTPEVIDKFFEAGCDDATFAARSGRLFATFSRTSGSIKDAILDAIACIRAADVGADVLRVDYCNLVTLSDIARKICRTRQLVHLYMIGTRGPGSFPGPVCELFDGTYLWMWCEVAYWLWENDMIKEDILRDAEEVELINSVLDMNRQKQTKPDLTAEVMRSVGA